MYFGRVLGLGLTPSGKPAAVYAVSGRSALSKARKAVIHKDAVTIEPTVSLEGQQDVKDLLFYNAIRIHNSRLVLGNGVHVDSILDSSIKSVLDKFGPENDVYKTPRIAGVIDGNKFSVGMIKEDNSAFETDINPSSGFYAISTYSGEAEPKVHDFKNLSDIAIHLNFSGETAQELADSAFKWLDANLAVCTAAAVFDGSWKIAVHNKTTHNKGAYSEQKIGNHPEKIVITEHFGDGAKTRVFEKVSDLRYATNPGQAAAFYGHDSLLGRIAIIKSGKGGLSQTNIEDVFYALDTLKYFSVTSCIVMKHENPSGFAKTASGPLVDVYKKARDCDYQAAFGGVVAFNSSVDKETAEEIAKTFVEVVVAPDYDSDAIEILNKSKNIRVLKFDDAHLKSLPKFTGDKFSAEFRILGNALLRYDPYLTSIKSAENLTKYVVSGNPSAKELDDLLTAWYVCIGVRSNAIVLVKNSHTIGIGTGQQDRITAMKLAIWKNKELHNDDEFSAEGASLASDGFFPFTDSIEFAAKSGVKYIVLPVGGQKWDEVVRKAQDLGIVLVGLPPEERCFSHH
ncbi:MAG: hypothetical protein HYT72_03055 [Candidatus Aenigmarchaeota archaeon]|nr:hypothetical protein [Candidatus Aenigmarchaeota archaeon]